MKKVFALLSVAAVFAFASCEDKKVENTTNVDTNTVVIPMDTLTPVAPDTLTPVAPDTLTPAKH